MATHRLPDGVYRRGERLWIRYMVRRHKYREPVKSLDPREAARIRRQRIEAHERGERTRDSGTLRVADLLDAVLWDYEVNGRRSVRTETAHVKALTAAIGRRLASEITTDDVEGLHLRWQRAGLTNASINRRSNILRRGFRLMVRAKKLHLIPYIPRLKEHSQRGRYIAPAELEMIGAHLPDYLQPFVAFAYDDGIRKGQLARTLRRYVDLERGVIAWPADECKRDTPHVVPLEPDIGDVETLRERLAQRRAYVAARPTRGRVARLRERRQA